MAEQALTIVVPDTPPEWLRKALERLFENTPDDAPIEVLQIDKDEDTQKLLQESDASDAEFIPPPVPIWVARTVITSPVGRAVLGRVGSAGVTIVKEIGKGAVREVGAKIIDKIFG